jgi:hypothetical protein
MTSAILPMSIPVCAWVMYAGRSGRIFSSSPPGFTPTMFGNSWPI